MSLDISLALQNSLERTNFTGIGTRIVGKVRDSYLLDDNRRIIITTDRISAFDRSLGTLPLKGQVINRCAHWWFEQTAAYVPNHQIDIIDPNVSIVENCVPLRVEFVMRGYITGVTSTSLWKHYEQGRREFCGHHLPEGLTRNQKLPQPILTPSTKAESGQHDESLSAEELVAGGWITREDFECAAELSKQLFGIGQTICADRNLLLVDTKYEFGKRENGDIILIDEVHTPDSSRYWFADSYEECMSKNLPPHSFDKEFLRRWLNDQGFTGDGQVPFIPDAVRIEAATRYIRAYEAITQQHFDSDYSSPRQRIATNLARYLKKEVGYENQG